MESGRALHKSRSFRNKIIYTLCIIFLMIPMFLLSQPSSGRGSGGEHGSPGGLLERLRSEDKINVEDVGEVNMTAETVRLGTFGLNGVAQMMLWQKAEEAKKKKDWSTLAATLNQLIILNPHLESVWRFQGWNLAYNVSVECDNYKDRYEWVKRGIRFLESGTKYNPRSIRITWDVGWTTAQKISRSDERVQFRQLFREDDEFNKDRPLEERDSWIVGRLWYRKAEALNEKEGVDLGTISPTLFFSYAPNAQAYYSDNIEQDGIFDHRARRAWETFSAEWKAFGEKELDSATGDKMRLEDEEKERAKADMYREQLEALSPGLYQRLVDTKRARLTPLELEAVDTPFEERTADQHNIASDASEKIRVSNEEWAGNLPPDLRTKGMELAKLLDAASQQAQLIRRYRMIVNYKFWRLRGQLEKTDEIMEARRLIYEADIAFMDGDLVSAKDNYDAALRLWNQMIRTEQFDEIIDEEMFGSDLRELIDKYEIILSQLNQTLPADFPLREVLERTSPTDDALLYDMRRRLIQDEQRGFQMIQ
ncbi:MAG: hypothetical protein Q4D38_12745 [Planctomycetia bacterium]|nr:hypothetical protein [Planctomycetia bacterium]